ncbi:isochorismate synthase [Bacillus sp. Marseille-P3661]|uniref:isochorismate synthase n=1 Tax=Bacillus sp. Marseille-P3661 TaxID=1936234 RepID=UPI000C83A97B|nr:isochorismate synthase [Bacillus sp. Marseille-P3661]
MITIQHRGLHNNVALGVEKARVYSRSILVSQSTKVSSNIDPISFYQSGKHYKGERVYWSAPNSGFLMVGIGNAYTFNADANDFEKLEQEWNELVEESLIDIPEKRTGIGPVVQGAFSFDPKKEKTNLWRNFPVAKLTIPTFLLTISNNEVWFTINTIVKDTTNIDSLVSSLVEEQNQLLNNSTSGYSGGLGQTFTKIKEVSKEQWIVSVDKVARQIRQHEIEKVVLAREIRIESDLSFLAEDILNRLRAEQPTSYIFALESGEDCFIGASPERLVKKEGTEVLSTCLAGSIARGKTTAEDDVLGNLLLNDEKNLHEHNVVVRAITTAFKQCCEQISIPEKPVLYKVRDIQHLYTPVVGKIKDNVSLLTLVQKLHPTPALGGYPQQEALQKIREVEALDRGLYAGPIGWLDTNGNGEFAVAIRSGLLQGKEASLFAGCGIVGDSDPSSEYRETQIKFRPMLSALGGSFNDIK